MCIKKAKALFIMVMAMGLCNPSHTTTSVVSQNQENTQPDDQSECDEQSVVVTGSASCGSSGITGRVRIITNRKQLSTVVGGDIVVAPAINSFWYAGLGVASAIITEKNDNNAVALGKKLNIPVIIGASGATKKLVDKEVVICDPLTRNVYHVAYPTPQDAHFDVLTIQQKTDAHQTVPGLAKSTHSPRQKITVGVGDHLKKSEEAKSYLKENKTLSRVKRLVNSKLESFKEDVFDKRNKLKLGRHFSRWALKNFGGCDDFAIDSMPISYVLFDSSKESITEIVELLKKEDNIERIGSVLEQCKKKPGDINWARYVSHRNHIDTIPLPEGIDREKMKDPKAYAEVQDKIDAEERKVSILIGLFACFCIENKIPL